ncbi:MAG: ATP-binding protein [Anaerolineaceae bacterium]
MPKLNEITKKVIANTSRKMNNMQEQPQPEIEEQDVCPICHGKGFIRRDVPIDHPDFGKLQVCVCRSAEVEEADRQRLIQLSNLEAFRNMTFQNFNVEGRLGLGDQQVNSLKLALNFALQFSQNMKGWLLFMGPYGCGKTHLAAAVANIAVEKGTATLFLTVPDLLDWLRFSYGSSEQSMEDRFDEIRNIPLLVLDDLGTQNATPWAEEKLYQIINHRYVNQLPTIITTNQSLAEIDGRISSRLRDPSLVTTIRINAPDFRSPIVDTSVPQLSSLPLHSKQIFSNFRLRETEKITPEAKQSLEKAYHTARQFAEDPAGWLVLTGDFGCGKTHLAAAVGNYRNSMGESPMFVVVPDLLDHLRATFSPNSVVTYDELFEQVRTNSLLILDDLGTQSATPWAREKLYQILNYRYNAELPTVITTTSTLDELDPRIRSRMLDQRFCKFLVITAPAYRASPGTAGGTRAGRPRKTTLK